MLKMVLFLLNLRSIKKYLTNEQFYGFSYFYIFHCSYDTGFLASIMSNPMFDWFIFGLSLLVLVAILNSFL